MTRWLCNQLTQIFLQICKEVSFPISEGKTEFATIRIVFLGMLLDGQNLIIAVPEDKRIKTLSLLHHFLQRKKCTVKDMQQLSGLLNFLNRAIVPGRVFMRRMYNKYASIADKSTNLKAYHHINLDSEFRSDCRVWEQFLATLLSKAINRPFSDWDPTCEPVDRQFFSDASRNPELGFGCLIDNQRWTAGQWEVGFIDKYKPSIEYLELYAICVGLFTWPDKLRNIKLLVHCDNQSVVEIVCNC